MQHRAITANLRAILGVKIEWHSWRAVIDRFIMDASSWPNDPAQWRAAKDVEYETDAQSARPLEQAEIHLSPRWLC